MPSVALSPYNIKTACFCVYPFAINLWCKCPLSGLNTAFNDLPLIILLKIANIVSNIGNPSTISGAINTKTVYVFATPKIDITAKLNPKKLEPTSPTNVLAGLKLNGKRKKRNGESAFKLLTAKAFYTALNKLSDVDIPGDTGDFRLVDKKVVDVINSLPEHNKFLRGLFSWVGFEQYEYEYERKERYAGKTKYPLKKMLKLASDGIIGFSTKPIKVIGGFGITFVIVSIVILLYFILSKIFGWTNMVKGWTSIMFATTFVGGIVLLSLWIIGEYLVRIYDEAKQRPQYIIKKKINI